MSFNDFPMGHFSSDCPLCQDCAQDFCHLLWEHYHGEKTREPTWVFSASFFWVSSLWRAALCVWLCQTSVSFSDPHSGSGLIHRRELHNIFIITQANNWLSLCVLFLHTLKIKDISKLCNLYCHITEDQRDCSTTQCGMPYQLKVLLPLLGRSVFFPPPQKRKLKSWHSRKCGAVFKAGVTQRWGRRL